MLTAAVQSSGAKLPGAIAAEATEVKRRMLRVLDYHLADDPEVASELDDIRSGTEYVDTAADLMRLASLYQTHSETLAIDQRHYRPDDRDRARRLSLTIHQVLGDGRENSRVHWAEYRARAWTMLINKTATADA